MIPTVAHGSREIPAHRYQPLLAVPDLPEDRRAVEWIAEGCNVFNAFVPFYTNVDRTPGIWR